MTDEPERGVSPSGRPVAGRGEPADKDAPGGETSVEQAEERFRLLVHSVKDYGIFMLDPEGRIASWNEGAERIKGYTADDIIGRHFSTFYPEEDVASGKPAWELEVAVREGRFEDEGWRVRKDGTFFWANVIITALRAENGELVGFAKVTRDLTERRAAEERAIADARRFAEVEAENRAKSELLGAVSHELRTPLHAIGGYVDLLAMGIRGPLAEQQRDDLGRIRRSLEHLQGLIDHLLSFGRLDSGRIPYDLAPLPLASVVETVRPMIEPQATAKGIDLAWPSSGESAVARADRSKVEQILLNLLTNAVRHTPEGGRIAVAEVGEGDRVGLSVKDDGVGIPPGKLEAIFEPFVQLGRTLTSGHQGTGLGLGISRDLARAMGGDLTVESTLGEGSTFTLLLPRAEEE